MIASIDNSCVQRLLHFRDDVYARRICKSLVQACVASKQILHRISATRNAVVALGQVISHFSWMILELIKSLKLTHVW